MNVQRLSIPDVMLITPKVFSDARGYFYESFNAKLFGELTGTHVAFVQDNHSSSVMGTLRGLHYQLAPQGQGKLVRVVEGAVFDVVVDLRRSSPSFGQWTSAVLSAENQQQLWIPQGFAHGFLTLTDSAQFLYKTTDYYAPQAERCLAWNDPQIAIGWPKLNVSPVLSEKDRAGVRLADAECFDL
jgi:dTDP-4-dehydrorhamnose 3,5-epimerase